jgi:hypothetical protein
MSIIADDADLLRTFHSVFLMLILLFKVNIFLAVSNNKYKIWYVYIILFHCIFLL